jgi:hypothetical protein
LHFRFSDKQPFVNTLYIALERWPQQVALFQHSLEKAFQFESEASMKLFSLEQTATVRHFRVYRGSLKYAL